MICKVYLGQEKSISVSARGRCHGPHQPCAAHGSAGLQMTVFHGVALSGRIYLF